ncbi:hypothetical protein [Pseudovibrio exalbescens]|nr:hypothetical protein [Pseudovibrio exalbescens]
MSVLGFACVRDGGSILHFVLGFLSALHWQGLFEADGRGSGVKIY